MTVAYLYPEPRPGAWTAKDIVDLAGITYRQLDYWTRTGVLRTIDEDDTPGSGHFRYYGTEDLETAWSPSPASRRTRVRYGGGGHDPS